MKTLDVLLGLIEDPAADLPSLGELVTIEPLGGDSKLLYETLSKETLAAAVQDAEYDAAEQGAFMQFHKMETLVESIADKSAKKRFALILGDPGVGKSINYFTPVTIKVSDEVGNAILSLDETLSP